MSKIQWGIAVLIFLGLAYKIHVTEKQRDELLNRPTTELLEKIQTEKEEANAELDSVLKLEPKIKVVYKRYKEVVSVLDTLYIGGSMDSVPRIGFDVQGLALSQCDSVLNYYYNLSQKHKQSLILCNKAEAAYVEVITKMAKKHRKEKRKAFVKGSVFGYVVSRFVQIF